MSSSVTPWTVAHQAPLFMAFSRQEYWSGFSCPSPGDLPDPGMESTSLMSPAVAGRFFTTSTNLDSILKSRDITLPIKVHVVKATVFQIVKHRFDSWIIKELGAKELMLSNCGSGEDS